MFGRLVNVLSLKYFLIETLGRTRNNGSGKITYNDIFPGHQILHFRHEVNKLKLNSYNYSMMYMIDTMNRLPK